jgi:dUTP pyrophosphatase
MALIAFNKSGVSAKLGLDVLACVVDCDYQGEIHLSLVNTSNEVINILPGQKLVQFILLDVNICPIEEVNDNAIYNSVTERGSGGFGSTG